MEFSRLDMLWLLSLLPVAIFLAWWAARRRAVTLKAWGESVQGAGATAGRRRWLRDILWMGALIGLVGGLSQPKGGAAARLLHRQGSDVVFVLDLSKSMLARDVTPDRLKRAVFEIERLLDKIAGDRVGLVVFSGTSFMQSPLTVDVAVLRNLLTVADPMAMPYPGSNIGAGLERGLELLAASPSGSRALVLLTDGEETTGNAREAALRAASIGVPIYVLAVGTARGEPIPVLNNEGQPEILRDAKGAPVFSKLDESGLRELASATGGKYFRLGQGGDANAVERVLSQLEKKTLDERTVTERAELYVLLLAPALLLLVAGLWISERSSL